MGVQKKTRKFAQMKRAIKARDERLKKPEAKKETPKEDQLTRQVTQAPSNMFFAANTALGPPYHVLVDTNFVSHAIRAKQDLLTSMMDLLYAKCVPTFSDCTIAELEKLGDKYRLALRVAKDPRWSRVKCSHKGTYADDCIVDRVTKHRIYIVATNDQDLCRRLRKIPAGIIGLSTALYIQQHLSPSQRVLLAARDFPHSTSLNYASPWAGAHYRPVPGSNAQHTREEAQARRTYAHFKTLAAQEPGAGVQSITGIEHLENPPAEYLDEKNIQASYGHLDGFEYLRPEEVPGDVKWGVRYKTFVVNSPVYCSWLLREFVLRGGEVKEYTFVDLREGFYLAERVRALVNCSGLGFGDEKSYIIRGQTCLVRNPCSATITRQNSDGSWSFCIPRPLGGGTIIGGTKQPHNWDPNPSMETRAQLLANAAKWFPFQEGNRREFDVIRDIVGRRPAREGGMRIEVEKMNQGQGLIVHAYGAGGRGFELSWGVAEDVYDLMRQEELLKEKASL
ncbi:Fcf1-domain-containing protein [Aspergillus eucalypticola CBS 122712]|uniref:Fcf1-domain-containing protein n=1 Tax=Aspergillus eucalypticola (strain CBS 122712 / IBT 29274) TaxID=1448314 RepID=A0A317UUU3_ASPEC|nr:Fcf1-domain-containing protein [Aspergillus eucalypticola CBS 122712]PWY65764.1 Fcf1-domain-containing protein [Aspergillus eucalypticola CBS 122712]